MTKWNVPIYQQRTAELCWEACGHMMWDWHHRADKLRQSQYNLVLPGVANVNRGLNHREMDFVYKRLSLRSLQNPKGQNVRHALRWSPVVVTSADRRVGHAMVVTQHINGRYVVINPCSDQRVEFALDPATGAVTDGTGRSVCGAATESSMPEAEIDRQLGQFIWYW